MKLAIGTVQFGMNYGVANKTGQVDRLSAKKILALAKDYGINTVDTAIGYGSSEKCLGDVCPSDFNVISKLPLVPESATDIAGWAIEQVKSSLRRLNRTSLSGLLLHRPDQLLEGSGGELFNALRNLKENGLVKKIGISIYSPELLDEIVKFYRFDIVQAPLNIFDRRLVRSGWLERAKSMGIEIHTRSTFLQGVLLLPLNQMPDYFSKWHQLFKTWHIWLKKAGVTAVDACLSYPMSFENVDKVVIGVDSVSHLQQILSYQTKWKATDLPDIESEDEELINPSCWVLD